MKKYINIAIVFIIIIILIIVNKNYNNKTNTKIPDENPTETNLTISNVEVKEDKDGVSGAVYINFSDGTTKVIAKSKATEDIADIHEIISYRKAFISPNNKYIAIEVIGFEESSVEVYAVDTNILHKRTYGVIDTWTNDNLLKVKSCNLAAENCSDKISISGDRPWLFKQINGVVVGNATLTDSTDFISNIKKSSDLSIFSKALNLAGSDAIKGTGPFTIFVPTDEAFKLLSSSTLANLFKPENKDQLIELIRNHVVANEYNINEIKDGMKINTINNKTLSFTSNEFSFVKINTESTVDISNIYSNNGIIHIINKVLLP